MICHLKRSILFFVMIFSYCFSFANECQQFGWAGVDEISVSVNTLEIERKNSPKELFGFNLPWREFQAGFYRNGAVRNELLDFLAPFKGAVYRYPGGSPTNWFEWRKAIGAVDQRPMQYGDFEQYAVVKFGIDEFAKFVSRVDGRAILTMNLVGPRTAPLSPSELAGDSKDFLEYVRKPDVFGCLEGGTCRVMAIELGNELDWPPYSWPAQIYNQRANAVVDGVSSSISDIQWIANGRTAPWAAVIPDYKNFNSEIAIGLAGKVQAIAIHPYYDGVSIPSAMRYVNEYAKTWNSIRSGSKVFITEHARWPSKPVTGNWDINWNQATGLGGAISSADFLLSIIGNSQVAAANWHALGVLGPWQLIRWNKVQDTLYPSPVYWGLRTLREGYLDHVVKTSFSQPLNIGYSGGYDIKIVGMKSADGQFSSVLGINRNNRPYQLRITWSGGLRKAGEGVLRTITGGDMLEDNNDSYPQKIVMKANTKTLASARSVSTWCIPAHSVFSIVEP